ncbi:MAG: chemotaxis protein CheW [Gemmatimonadaceae bacterium]
MPLSRSTLPILLARLDGTQIGFSAAAVSEIVRAVAIAPLAGAPGVIEGAINLHGRIVPVVDVRQRLALPALAVAASQFLVILETSDRLIAVRVDDVDDVTEIPSSSLEAPAALSPVLQRLQGIAAIESGALVIYDIDTFLTQAERDALDRADTVGE